jgi:hypothetical protein
MIQSYFPNGQWVNLRDFSKIVSAAAASSAKGTMMSLDATRGINAHLRPGYMVAKETCADCMTTADLRANGTTQMIANRDEQGHAVGEIFIDEGDSLSELSTQTYEYYQFQLSANSIKKWVKNDKNSGPVGKGIDSFVVANAKQLLSTNFACWTSEADGSATPLTIGVNATLNTLTLSSPAGAIQPFYVKDIFFGNSNTDLNLCGANGTVADQTAGANTQFYKMAAEPDLSSNNATINITGNVGSSAQPDLTLFLQVLNAEDKEKHDTDILCISWTYTDHNTTKKMPYTVPMDIAGIDKTVLS